ncbi:glycosyltransferase [Scopulibacillus cellulosilyticus]|uniref:Glycosyltransferase n=1 Tax=Scopulibacillus cellulosilyticus TaxID=2665665 RepID=A0ABW2Q049_9BACL
MKEKILFISTIFPYPTDNGKKVVLGGLLEYLINNYNVSYVVIDSSEFIQYKDINMYSIEKPSNLNKLYNLFYFTVLKRKKTIQESMLYSKRILKELNRIIKSIRPDTIIFDTLRTGQYKLELEIDFNIKNILYLDDLFSIRYEKMLEVMDQKNVELEAIGNFKRFIPPLFHSILKVDFVQRKALSMERKLITKRENNLVNYFNSNLLINPDEVKLLKKRSRRDNIYEIKPNLRKVQTICREFNGDPKFLFLGSLNIPHNKVSLLYFLNSQLEKILKIIPDFKLVIIGKHPSEELIDLSEKYNQNIEIKGFVENLGEVFHDACALLIPLLFGSGVKLKTIEALNFGIPIISTSYGTEGINLKNGVQAIIEDDLNKYPELMKRLCDKSLNQKLSLESKEFFKNNYSRNIIEQHYYDLLNK